MALEDAQRAVGLVRFHAADSHTNPHKIGVLGFSAGGHLVTAIRVRILNNAYIRLSMPQIKKAVVQILQLHFIQGIYGSF